MIMCCAFKMGCHWFWCVHSTFFFLLSYTKQLHTSIIIWLVVKAAALIFCLSCSLLIIIIINYYCGMFWTWRVLSRCSLFTTKQYLIVSNIPSSPVYLHICGLTHFILNFTMARSKYYYYYYFNFRVHVKSMSQVKKGALNAPTKLCSIMLFF